MKIKEKKLLWSLLVIAFLFNITKAVSNDEQRVWVGDFEDGVTELTRENNDSVWYEQGNLAEVVTDNVRSGDYAVKFFVDRKNSTNSRRSMIIPKGDDSYEFAIIQDLGKDYWYGFSTYFPESWTKDNIWDLFAQMHGRPDLDIGEDYRNPFFGMFTDGDNISINNIWDIKKNTYESGERVYSGERELWEGPIERKKWIDWVIHAKWSYKDDGLIEIWKNKEKIVDVSGPNCFNDERGGYFDIGIYKGWGDRDDPVGMVSTRTIYFDEIRIFESDNSDSHYGKVSPPALIEKKSIIDIKLNNNDNNEVTIDENILTSTEISEISTVGGTSGFKYSLVNGDSDSDNSKFLIKNNKLIIKFVPDYEKPIDIGGTVKDNIYLIKIGVVDDDLNSFEKKFLIKVRNKNEKNKGGKSVKKIVDNSTISEKIKKNKLKKINNNIKKLNEIRIKILKIRIKILKILLKNINNKI